MARCQFSTSCQMCWRQDWKLEVRRHQDVWRTLLVLEVITFQRSLRLMTVSTILYLIFALARYSQRRAHTYGSLIVDSMKLSTATRSSIPPYPFAIFSVPSMSSKRGRKRNDNLPPNRARDVQRAFRTRRAAHLEVGPSSLYHTHLSLTPFFLLHRPSSSASLNWRKRMATFAPP